MSVRFLNPKNVTHGTQVIAKVREVRVESRMTDVRRYFGDGSAFAKLAAAFRPAVEIELVCEDAGAALAISPGATATLSFQVVDAETGATKTVAATNATYVGPSGHFGGPKQGPAVATMPFACWSSTGANPISFT
jgi:hypothetical protein